MLKKIKRNFILLKLLMGSMLLMWFSVTIFITANCTLLLRKDKVPIHKIFHHLHEKDQLVICILMYVVLFLSLNSILKHFIHISKKHKEFKLHVKLIEEFDKDAKDVDIDKVNMLAKKLLSMNPEEYEEHLKKFPLQKE